MTVITYWDDSKKWIARPVIFLISGLAGVGKTTSANFLKDLLEERKIKAVNLHFATGVKFAAKSCFDWDETKDKKGRKLLQDIGRIGRAYNENIWVDQIIKDIKFNLELYDVYIIDDWRFPNELNQIKKESFWLNIVTIRVTSTEHMAENTDYSDPSESSLPTVESAEGHNLYDYVISNNGTKNELKELLEFVVLDCIEGDYKK